MAFCRCPGSATGKTLEVGAVVSGRGRARETDGLERRCRPAEQEALAELAAERAQRLELLGRLDALGDDLEPERPRRARRSCARTRPRAAAAGDAVDERLARS